MNIRPPSRRWFLPRGLASRATPVAFSNDRSRSWFVRFIWAFNDYCDANAGQIGFLLFFMTLLRIFYIFFLKNPAP
jgi:hypothetical protein